MAEENDSERDDEESSDSEPDNDSTDSPNDGGDGGDSGDVDAEFGQSESSEDLDRRSEREAEAEARQLEREAEALEGDGSMAALLGPERWVQFAFIAAGVALFFLADRLSTLIWGQFAEPDPAIVSAIAGATAIFGTFALYRHPAVNKLADEVVSELSKVTWPTRDEVWVSTIVVVITSIVAAVYTGLFDAMWSALTNIVYG